MPDRVLSWQGPARLALLVVLLQITPGPLVAQDVTARSPNLTGGWVGAPGVVQFHFLHRFWKVQESLVNSPTFLLGVPLPARTLAGVRYASSSRIVADEPSEWELFGRWALPFGDGDGTDVALTGALNAAAGSADGELSLSRQLLGMRLLAAGRFLSDARGSGDAGWGAAAGIAISLRPGLALSGDYGATWIDGERARPVWGVGLQLRIPVSPHSLSLHATNSGTSTLQGASLGGRTTWGFEFTVPITLARYLP